MLQICGDIQVAVSAFQRLFPIFLPDFWEMLLQRYFPLFAADHPLALTQDPVDTPRDCVKQIVTGQDRFVPTFEPLLANCRSHLCRIYEFGGTVGAAMSCSIGWAVYQWSTETVRSGLNDRLIHGAPSLVHIPNSDTSR